MEKDIVRAKTMNETYYELFARSPRSSMISPFELNREGRGGYALVLRYAGCNLRCPLCYAWRYAWFPRREGYVYRGTDVRSALEKLPKLQEKIRGKINWIRVQGGEPCLSFDRTLLTLRICREALQIVHEAGLNKYQNTRAIIQMNGVLFSTLNEKLIQIIRKSLEESLKSLSKGRIVFEFSFKDPTGGRKFGNTALLEVQIRGFRIMLDKIIKPLWNEGFENIALYLIAGLGPSIDLHNISVMPIDPYSLPEEYPLFHPKTWSCQFELLYREFIEDVIPCYEAYKDFRNNTKTNQGRKIPLEEFEPTRFQIAWISGYAGKYQDYGLEIGKDIPRISEILRRLSDQLDKQWLGLCRMRNGGIKEEWLKVLKQIPIARDPDKLKSLVKEINQLFYPTHPKVHYPYL